MTTFPTPGGRWLAWWMNRSAKARRNRPDPNWRTVSGSVVMSPPLALAEPAAPRPAGRPRRLARRRQRRRLRPRPRRQAQLTGELATVALGALGLVVAEDQRLERVLALLADVLVQGHGVVAPPLSFLLAVS